MTEFENINSLANGDEKREKLKEYYENNETDSWLNNNVKYSIIKFKDRIEYKHSGKYHRINGPAIDYNDEKKDSYYFKGERYDNIDDWKKAILKIVRKVKLDKLDKME